MASEFTLSSGVHRGAIFSVHDELVIIGGDSSCDVCLSDAGLSPRHLALVRRSNGVSIRSLEGQVSVNGEVLTPNTSALLLANAEIALGESGVRIQFTASADARPEPLPSQPPPRAAPMVRHKSSIIAASVLLMTGVLAAGLSARPLESSSDSSDIDTVRALLQREQLSQQVAVSKTSYGVELSGVISAESASRLRAALTDTLVTNTVIADQDLLEQVRDVFRTHGYDAAATYVGNAEVRIENLDETHQRVQRAAATARADIPPLRSLSFAAVEAEQPPDQPSLYRSGTKHRFTAHLMGATAYLASDDGARYFNGSMLPDGHTLRRITEHAVLLEREGQRVWRKF